MMTTVAILLRAGLLALIAVLWSRAGAVWVHALLLLPASSIFLSLSLRLLDLTESAQLYLPAYLRPTLRENLGLIVATTYYLSSGSSLVGKILSVGLFTVATWFLVSLIPQTILAFRCTRGIVFGRSHALASARHIPFILVTARPHRQAARHVAAFVTHLGRSFWRNRSTTLVKSDRSARFGAQLERIDSTSHSPMAALSGLAGAIFRFFFAPEALVAVIDATALTPRKRRLASESALAHVAFLDLQSRILLTEEHDRTLQSLVRNSALGASLHQVQQNHTELVSSMLRIKGPCFLVELSISPILISDSTEKLESDLSGYVILEEAELRFRRAHSRVGSCVRNSSLIASTSDSLMSSDARDFLSSFTGEGLAPVADAYLRFRTAVSDVERFSVLLECFEALIKYSTFALLSAGNESSASALSPQATLVSGSKPPSLGTWVRLLRSLSKSTDHHASKALQQTANFWEEAPPLEANHEVVRTLNRLGIGPRSTAPKTNGQWLEWLTSVRNVTRGHGGIQEKTSALMWSGLHRAFLESLVELDEMVLRGTLTVQTANSGPVNMAGWRRGPNRLSTLDVPPTAFGPVDSRVLWEFSDRAIDLSPFTAFERNACWTWNGRARSHGQADYIDYASGKVGRLSLETLRQP